MSIDKPDFSGLVKEKIPFTVIPNYVLQNINFLEALAVWCHLISLSESWNVNRAYLMNKFSIGRDKLDKIMKYLIDNYLIEYLWIKNPDGTVNKVIINVKNGEEYLEKIVNKQELVTTTLKISSVDESTTLKIHSVDKPLSGKTAPIKDIYNKKQNKKIKKKKVNLEIPTFICIESWNNFVQFRKDIKSAMNEQAKKLAINKLTELKNKGHDPVKVIEQSILNGWKGLFPLQQQKNNTVKTQYKAQGDTEKRSIVREWGVGHPDYDRRHGINSN